MCCGGAINHPFRVIIAEIRPAMMEQIQ